MASATPCGTGVEVFIPARDEAPTIAGVVADFRRVLPGARVIVYDDASTDDTARLARGAGAEVRSVTLRGKGAVMRAMFASACADVVLVCDGDGTYPADRAPALIERVCGGDCHMVSGARYASRSGASPWPFGHVVGNHLIACALRLVFGVPATDPLTGYRAFTLGFVRAFPARSRGFAIETELELWARRAGARTCEVPVLYRPRCEGSRSKLSAWRDGLVIGALLARSAVLDRAAALALPLLAACVLLAFVLPGAAHVLLGAAGMLGVGAGVLEWLARARRRACAASLPPA